VCTRCGRRYLSVEARHLRDCGGAGCARLAATALRCHGAALANSSSPPPISHPNAQPWKVGATHGRSSEARRASSAVCPWRSQEMHIYHPGIAITTSQPVSPAGGGCILASGPPVSPCPSAPTRKAEP